MARKKKTKLLPKQNIVKLRPGANIGAPAAEDDAHFLTNCFVKLPALEEITDQDSNRRILIARTGAGKSAILRRIADTQENVSWLNPKGASFDFVSNSVILNSLSNMGVNLHLFYEYVWKHILCVHIITKCMGIKNDDKLPEFLAKLDRMVRRDRRKQIVKDYLKRWEHKLWIDADEVSREITNEITSELAAKLGLSLQEVEAKLESLEKSNSKEVKQFVKRAQPIINSLQLKELNETITALSELLEIQDKKFFILIDDLDARWVSEEHQYPLILALIESLRTFGRIPQVKIVVALREDIYEAAKSSNTDRLFQSEKLEGLIVRIKWTEELLKELIETRLRFFFKCTYTKSDILITDILPEKIRGTNVCEFIISRGMQRPRDAVAFVNCILELNTSANLPLVQKHITSAEPYYSRNRLDSLCQEWRSVHPLLKDFIDVLASKPLVRCLEQLDEEELLDIAILVEDLNRKYADNVEKIASKAYDTKKERQFEKLARELLCCLYKVGAVGIKLSANEPYWYSFENIPTIEPSQLGLSTKFKVVPMLAPILNIIPEKKAA